MGIRYEDVDGDIRRIYLSGRLDTVGSEQVAPEFSQLVNAAKGGVIVELSKVTFLSSMGIRALIAGAKARQAKGRQMVLQVAENDVVERTLAATGIDELIPVFEDPDEAEQALRS
jgi:anti-sigma B factor antagonist